MKRRNKIVLIILGGLGTLFIVAYLAIFHLGLLEYIINRELKIRIQGNLPLKVSIADISGDYYSTLVVKDIYVVYQDSLEMYTLAHVPEIILQYSIESFWQRRLAFKRVSINSANITLKQSENGKWIFPSSKKESQEQTKLLDFELNEIILNELGITLDMNRDTLFFPEINFMAQLRGREETYSADIKYFSCVSSDTRYNFVSAGGKFTLSGKNLVFQDLAVKTDSSDIDISGSFSWEDKLQSRARIDARNLNLNEFSSFIKAGLNGNLSANGDLEFSDGRIGVDILVSGEFMDRRFDSLHTNFSYADKALVFDTVNGSVFHGCGIHGHGKIDLSVKPPIYQFIGILDNFNLNNLVFDTYRSNLSGMINLNGESFKGDELILDINADLNESWFDEYHAHKIIGDMTITTDSIRFYDNFAVKYHNNFFLVNGKLDYHGPLSIDGRAEFNDLSAFNSQIFIDRMGGRGEAVFSAHGELNNPNITGNFYSDSLWIYEIFSRNAAANYDIDRFLYDREGDVDIILRNGRAYNLPYDSIYSHLMIDSQYVIIDSSLFINEHAQGNGMGILDYLSYPQKLILDTVNIDLLGLPLNNEGDIVVNVDSAGYEFKSCKLNRPVGSIEWNGRVNYDETMVLKISGDRIDIAPWIDLHLEEYQIKGLISGDVNLSGDFLSPIIQYDGKIDSLSYQGLVLGDLKAYFNYQNEEINIDSVSLKSEYGYYNARGTFPINLAFSRDVAERFPQAEQNVVFTAYDKRLDLVSKIFDEIEDDSLIGEFNANFQLAGFPLKPKLNGKASIRNGNMKLYELTDPLEELYVDITMIDENIYLDSVSAICKNGGKQSGFITCSGDLIVIGVDTLDYNISITLEKFPGSYELGDIKGSVSGEMTVIGITPPTVYGDIEVISALYRENFEVGNEGWVIMSELERVNSWNLNLDVEAKSNLWVKNDDIDAEMAMNLNFIRQAGQYRFVGTMETLRGKGYLADGDFRLEPGGLIVYEDIEYPNPRLDLYATTKVRKYEENTVTQKIESYNVDLRIHVTGTLDEPIISAAEGSEFSTEDILSMIFAYYQPSSANGDAGQDKRFQERIAAGVTGLLSLQVGRIGARTLGVETFEIDPVYYGDKFDAAGTSVTVGMYARPDLYIYGKKSFSFEEIPELGFEYRLGKILKMEGRVDEDKLYRLFFNFHWDY